MDCQLIIFLVAASKVGLLFTQVTPLQSNCKNRQGNNLSTVCSMDAHQCRVRLTLDARNITGFYSNAEKSALIVKLKEPFELSYSIGMKSIYKNSQQKFT